MVRDKYRIDAFIATGSMAVVYAATHRNGSRVALKILHKDLASDASMVERFRREGYFANAIGHPGVVRAIDDDLTEDGCVFLVMELLEGENLEERRKRLGGRVALAEVLDIADAMLDVLSAAHGHEVLHRDLKPENVYITRKNEVKLLDFGVARFNDGRSSSDMTAVGMVLGTPAFMPPEQALGKRQDVDARSDIWGVGATLFTVLTGESVHTGSDAKAKLIATARTPARPIRDVLPDIPRSVAAVIDRALAFDRAERWADAPAMREALRWARMSVDGKGSQTGRNPEELPPSTRRGPEDEPTLAGAPRPKLESFDDSTAKRPAINRQTKSVDGVYTSAPLLGMKDKDAAPATERAARPPSMAPNEEPTFSLRNDPVFSLRKGPSAPPRPAAGAPPPAARELHEPPTMVRQADVPAPITERLPGNTSPNPTPRSAGKLDGTATAEQPPLAETLDGSLDAGAIFRAALARATEGTDLATLPRIDRSDLDVTVPPKPRPAAGEPLPPPEANAGMSNSSHPSAIASGGPMSPAVRTVPGLGAPPPALAADSAPPIIFHAPKRDLEFAGSTPPAAGAQGADVSGSGASYPSNAPPRGALSNPPHALHSYPPAHSYPPPGQPSYSNPPPGQGSYSNPPPGQGSYSNPPPGQGSYSNPPPGQGHGAHSYPPPNAYASYPPPAMLASEHPPSVVHHRRPSLTPDDPGPLLATIAPKRRGGFVRVFVPIMIGVLAGVATYILVVRQRPANATNVSASATSATMPSSALAASGSGAGSALAPPPAWPLGASPSSTSASSASAAAPASAATSASVAAAPVKKKPRPKPKPPASAPTAATAATTTPEPAPTAAPEPTPAPAPTPNDTLPRKEDN